MSGSIELIDGYGANQLRHVVKQLGYNKDVDVEYATVTAGPPDLRIKVDNTPLELDVGDFVVCEHLTKHTRTAKINGGTDVEIEFSDALKAGDRVIVVSANSGQDYVIIDRMGGVSDGA